VTGGLTDWLAGCVSSVSCTRRMNERMRMVSRAEQACSSRLLLLLGMRKFCYVYVCMYVCMGGWEDLRGGVGFIGRFSSLID